MLFSLFRKPAPADPAATLTALHTAVADAIDAAERAGVWPDAIKRAVSYQLSIFETKDRPWTRKISSPQPISTNSL